MRDSDLIERFKDKFSLEKNTTVIFIDGSKRKEGKCKSSVGVGIRFEKVGVETMYSLNKKCSIYSAEKWL